MEAPDDAPVLPEQVETAVYRIADEALTNAVEHAGASHCRVRLTFGADLVLEVLDDGRARIQPVPATGGWGWSPCAAGPRNGVAVSGSSTAARATAYTLGLPLPA